MMQEADSELLLTDYLLNFEEEGQQECSVEAEWFSGVESSDNDEDLALSSFAKSLKPGDKTPAENTTKADDNPANGEPVIGSKSLKPDDKLLLTDYLLNFEEDGQQDCSVEAEGFSSGVESSDNDEDVPGDKTPAKNTTKTDDNPANREPVVIGRKSLKPDDKPPAKTPPKKSLKLDDKTPAKNTTKTVNGTNGGKPQPVVGKTRRKRVRDYTRENELRKLRRYKQALAEYESYKEFNLTPKECKQLKESNKALNDKNIELGERVSNLERQVEYLESVIANESSISAILGVIKKHSGLSFQKNPLQMNSLKRKRVDNNNVNDENVLQKKSLNGGVCLHLTPGRMSLEFCRECDLSAADE